MSGVKTLKNAIEESVRSSLVNFCGTASQQISEYLRTKHDVEVSAEEICAVWEMPYRTPNTPGPAGSSVATVLPSIPSYFQATESPAKAKRGGGRGKKGANDDLPQCSYKLVRGKSAGQQCANKVCGDPSIPGGDRYCKACLKKSTVKAELETPTGKTTIAPPSLPNSAIPVAEEQPQKGGELEVNAIEGREGWYQEQKHGFVVQQTSDGNIVAHSVMNSDGSERPLTESEKVIARGLGLAIVETKTTIPSMPPIPHIPQVQVPLS